MTGGAVFCLMTYLYTDVIDFFIFFPSILKINLEHFMNYSYIIYLVYKVHSTFLAWIKLLTETQICSSIAQRKLLLGNLYPEVLWIILKALKALHHCFLIFFPFPLTEDNLKKVPHPANDRHIRKFFLCQHLWALYMKKFCILVFIYYCSYFINMSPKDIYTILHMYILYYTLFIIHIFICKIYICIY